MDREQSSFLLGANAGFLADLYQRYLKNPSSVDSSWAKFFAELQDDPRALSRDFADASWGLRELPQQPAHPERKPNGNGGLAVATDLAGSAVEVFVDLAGEKDFLAQHLECARQNAGHKVG